MKKHTSFTVDSFEATIAFAGVRRSSWRGDTGTSVAAGLSCAEVDRCLASGTCEAGIACADRGELVGGRTALAKVLARVRVAHG